MVPNLGANDAEQSIQILKVERGLRDKAKEGEEEKEEEGEKEAKEATEGSQDARKRNEHCAPRQLFVRSDGRAAYEKKKNCLLPIEGTFWEGDSRSLPSPPSPTPLPACDDMIWHAGRGMPVAGERPFHPPRVPNKCAS